MYVTVPIPSRYSDDENPIEPFAFDVSSESCSTLPFTLRVVDGENRYRSLATVMMSDADFAVLKRVVLEADRDRRVAKENYLEALKVELGLTDDGTEPTCDICNERQIDTEHMTWNGETGNHYECEGKGEPAF